MAVTSNIFTISYSGEPGDGPYSLTNRYIYALKEKLLGHGFNMFYENSVTDINTQSKEYLLSLDGISGVRLRSTATAIYVYVGIIKNGNSIDPAIGNVNFNVSGTGVSTYQCFFSNNFYFLQNLAVSNILVMFFKTNYGWCPCGTAFTTAGHAFFVTINGQYYQAYIANLSNNPSYLNLDNNHVLYSPSFVRQTVPGASTNTSDRRLDDTIKYTGSAYSKPDTLYQLNTNTMYKINDTNEIFYYGGPLSLIYFD